MFSVSLVLIWLALGLAAGFLGGLIGIGGGFVLVPGLLFLFQTQAGFEAVAMPLALGTTLACVIFTALSSATAHFKRGAVEIGIVKGFAPYIAPAAAFGALLSTRVPVIVVKAGFAAFCIYSATRMLFFSKTLAKEGAIVECKRLALPGSFFGTLCGLLGIGGANLFVPYLMKRNVDIRKAMATASALQVPIAIVGTAAYVALGLGKDLPKGSLGYVYLPALIVVLTASMAAAPLGVMATHALPVPTIRKVFAVFTGLIGARMLTVAFV